MFILSIKTKHIANKLSIHNWLTENLPESIHTYMEDEAVTVVFTDFNDAKYVDVISEKFKSYEIIYDDFEDVLKEPIKPIKDEPQQRKTRQIVVDLREVSNSQAYSLAKLLRSLDHDIDNILEFFKDTSHFGAKIYVRSPNEIESSLQDKPLQFAAAGTTTLRKATAADFGLDSKKSKNYGYFKAKIPDMNAKHSNKPSDNRHMSR